MRYALVGLNNRRFIGRRTIVAIATTSEKNRTLLVHSKQGRHYGRHNKTRFSASFSMWDFLPPVQLCVSPHCDQKDSVTVEKCRRKFGQRKKKKTSWNQQTFNVTWLIPLPWSLCFSGLPRTGKRRNVGFLCALKICHSNLVLRKNSPVVAVKPLPGAQWNFERKL